MILKKNVKTSRSVCPLPAGMLGSSQGWVPALSLLPQSTSSLRGETASISFTVHTSVYCSAQYSCLENPMDKGGCSLGHKESDMTEATLHAHQLVFETV